MSKLVQLKNSSGNIYPRTIDKYSSNETKTNRIWVDGKPIYRKVIQFNLSTTINSFQSVAHNINDLDIKINYDMVVMYNNEIYKTPNDFIIESKFGNSNFFYYNNNSYIAGKNATLILEYTKTTD